jgi:hypothetical protein
VTALDALLADAAKIEAGADPRAVLADSTIAKQIRTDAAAGRFAAWGESTVVDENTGSPVIPLALFAELHRLAGVPAAWPVGNAGLIHVYGYLLSTVETPYGAKRDRWTGGGVARALGLPPASFLPWLDEPTTSLERLASAIAPILSTPAPYEGTVLWAEERSDEILATTVVVSDPHTGDSALLYAVDGRLVTAFPVATVDDLLSGPPRLRYNAVVGSAGLALDRRLLRIPAG